MELAHLSAALVLGLVAKRLTLPPLVGFLIAGFALREFGYSSTPQLEWFADLGVTMLLFTIGLKLKIRTLLQPAIWAGATLHMALSVVLISCGLLVLAFSGLGLVADLDLQTVALIAFALSFSSTVFAVKLLDERGESGSLHGNFSIGILIMQDIFAVVFIAAAAGKVPSPWALVLLSLIPLRPLLRRLLDLAGHGELLILLGFVLTLGASEGFELVGVKGDLGALIVGALLAGYPKADEMAKTLLGFKEFLLVGFFLTIGLSGAPSGGALILACLLLTAIPIKAALYFVFLTRFRLRARTALFSSSTLANYSEFGLIVGSVGVSLGMIPADWLVVIAIALSVTFILGGPVRSFADRIYDRYHEHLRGFETPRRLPGDESIDPGAVQVAVLGMGRIGVNLYDDLRERWGDCVVGLEQDSDRAEQQRKQGRNVLVGDASDADFWERAVLSGSIRLVLLTMASFETTLRTACLIRKHAKRPLDEGKLVVAAIVEHPDEVRQLKDAGVELVYDIFSEAGHGLGESIYEEYLGRKERPGRPG